MSEGVKAAAVVTSINLPNSYVGEYGRLGIPLIIVADKKTPRWPEYYLNSPDIHFLSVEIQHDMFPRLSDAIGFDTYARKNIGYLYAQQMKIDVLIDTDDDTTPVRNPIEPITTSMPVLQAASSDLMWNPYAFFLDSSAEKPRIWPRGYPLSLIEKSDEPQPSPTTTKYDSTQADVYQFLIDGNPDVDSIQRLVQRDFVLESRVEYENKLIRLDSKCWSPGNTQASIWHGSKSFQYLYIPSTVTMRFCDILRMYVAQSNLDILFGGFWFNQVRNYHSLFKDFQDESELRNQAELLYAQLVKPNIRSLGITETYSLLVKSKMVGREELKVLDLFLEEST